MKKKSNLIYIFLMVIFFILLMPNPVGADSGWDSSYDYGGSSWSSSSDWGSSSDWSSSSNRSSSSSWSSSSDWNSHSNYSDYSGYEFKTMSEKDNIAITIAIFIAVVIIMVVSYINFMKLERNALKNANNNSYNKVTPLDENEILKILPDFNKEQFKQITFNIYKEIQVAWMNFDYETLRKDCTDELFNMYKSQLEALRIRQQKNIMSDFSLSEFEIIDIENNQDEVSIKTRNTIICHDYVVDKNNNVIRGNKNRQNIYYYEMTFIRSIKQNDKKCPNCGAELENSNSVICSYCNSKIINNTNHKWVLSKKQMIHQDVKH